MLEIQCSGSPFEIGFTHGHAARDQVRGSIAFYKDLFQVKCSMGWEQVTAEANKYVEPLEKTCSRYIEEIRGLAEGVGSPVSFLDILALNVRTEIMFGLFTDPQTPQHADVPSDGCTSLSWVDGSGTSFLAQNWDWQKGQGRNLIVCHINPKPGSGIPNLAMVTEAGIIGKIGLNTRGVGCCLNAIRARGVDRTKLPVHFALRTILESASREEAVGRLEASGIAGSAHILLGDESGAVGLECTPFGTREIPMDLQGRVFHTNHLVLEHAGVDEPPWLDDSLKRLARIKTLADATLFPGAGIQEILGMLKDEENCPCSINRRQLDVSTFETLFSIVMDLTKREALVKLGRPSESGDEIRLVL
ncbi:AAT-domain-containing protein [Cryphonectria parasitica EP155]|uniref:AAT-domain-containing protein n=1 Tax=Cryphonectria parasitica (strain ATCC 38755 / EP155) TaxID=660469 RepID=A0A9P5CMC5_CRYP1|nr:AAT-domain-containing protein [Cryphonectria parasitica EP155]KAF3763968.1 AAT-domain-containing protein [Cryphonectria parasitica EP155]